MSDHIENNNSIKGNKEASAFNTHEEGWTDVDLELRKIDTETQRPEATIIGQGLNWTNFDLEDQTPPKKHWWRHGRKSKIVIAVALVAMVVIAITVPTIVAVRNDGSKGIQ